MTVTLETAQRTGTRTWRLSWSSGLSDPTFYVYRDGELVGSTAQTSMDFLVDAGDSLVVEVLDDPDALPVAGYPARLLLAWGQVDNAEAYRVEEYIGSAWVLRAKVQDRGNQCFTWKSRPLEDCTSHQFRVVPVGDNANLGTALALTVLMVRHPDVPDVDYSYSALSATITIS